MPVTVTSAIAVAAGGAHALALLSDGRPVITHQPVGGTSFIGRDFTFRPTVTGLAPLSYQWQMNGADIADATNATLVLPNLGLANAGNYQLVVSNALAVATSVAVPLTVLDSPNLTLLSQPPASQTNYLGSKVILSVSIAGNGPLQYQWRLNGQGIAGATNQDLLFDPILLTNAGNYSVQISNQLHVVIEDGSRAARRRVRLL